MLRRPEAKFFEKSAGDYCWQTGKVKSPIVEPRRPMGRFCFSFQISNSE
jgi:hypothetical protein